MAKLEATPTQVNWWKTEATRLIDAGHLQGAFDQVIEVLIPRIGLTKLAWYLTVGRRPVKTSDAAALTTEIGKWLDDLL